jgi:capsid protein
VVRSNFKQGFASGTHGQMEAEYQAAKNTRFQRYRRIIQSGSGPDWHYRTQHDFMKIMEYARDMDRNDVVLGSIIDRSAINTIQGGAKLDFHTGDSSFDRDLLAGWREYTGIAENIDITGEDTLSDMEFTSFRSAKVDGDVWPVCMDDGRFQMFEAHRVRTPTRTKRNIFQGVELDGYRKPLTAWMTMEDMQFDMGQTVIKDYAQYPIRDKNGIRRVLQVHTNTKKRFTQTRGISGLAPCFDLIGMHDDIEFAAVLRQQVSNALIIFKERDKDFLGGSQEGLGETTQTTRQDGSVETLQSIGPGTIVSGQPGEKYRMDSPNVPGEQFLPHVKMILTLIGINLGMPLILVLMDASETNFSGWRGAFDQAKMGFQHNQRQMIRRFNDPVLQIHLAQRRIQSLSFSHQLDLIIAKHGQHGFYTWHQPTWPYINPMEDRQADLIAVANYQEAPSTNAARNGRDYRSEMRKGIADRGMAIEMAMAEADRLNSLRKGQPEVSWRELYTPLQPKNVSLSVSEQRGDTQQASAGSPKQGAAT